MKGHQVSEKLKSIKRENFSAQENISKLLEKIKKEDKKINSFIDINKNAINEAKEVDKKIREGKAGKLAGLGISIKSNINVKNLLISCASKTLNNYYGSYDADVIEKIKKEDGIILGMANMDEFAAGVSGETSFFGPTQNPKALGKIPGGSSSGPAATIAANFSDISLGSDTGGSIRNPASHCGVIGIKPSYGRVSRYGLIDLAMSLDQIGPLSKNVFESALMLQTISGKSNKDASTTNNNVDNYPKLIENRPKNLTIGICENFKEMSDPKIYDLLEKETYKLAENYGWKVEKIKLNYVDLAVQTYYPLVYVEFFSSTRKFDGRRYGRRIEDYSGHEVLRRILGGKEISMAEYKGKYYKQALISRQLIKNEFKKAFSKVDCLISPTVPKLPHDIGEEIKDPKEMYAYDAFTIPSNLAGNTSASIPTGKINNIPVGMHLMTNSFDELKLLQIMHAYEGIKK